MTKVLCLSVYQNRNWPGTGIKTMIEIAKKLDISGIELMFSSFNELFLFSPSPQDIKWIRKLDYVSIHAPFEAVNSNTEMIQQLDRLNEIYNLIDAQVVVIHPTNLPPPKILNKYTFAACTENTKRRTTISSLKKIFRKYPRLGLCIDVSHAYLQSEKETSKLIKTFQEKIVQIHMSGAHNGEDHLSLRGTSKRFLRSIIPIKNLDVPIIIEEDITSPSIGDLRKEIKIVASII